MEGSIEMFGEVDEFKLLEWCREIFGTDTSLIEKGITNGSSTELEEVWDWKGKTLS